MLSLIEGAMGIDESSLSLKTGDTDVLGNKVKRVLARDNDKRYAIWETEKGEILVDADNENLSGHPETQELIVKLVSLISRHPSLKTKYNSYLAHAYKMYFDGGFDASISILKSTYDEVTRQSRRWSKLAFLLGASMVTSLGVLVCGLLYYLLNSSDVAKAFIAGIAVSTLGGFMSVAGGLRELAPDPDETIGVNALYGGVRVVVAMIAGVVMTLLIRTGVILSFLQQKDAFSGFLVACFVAGFSERFVYKALLKIEDNGTITTGAPKHRRS